MKSNVKTVAKATCFFGFAIFSVMLKLDLRAKVNSQLVLQRGMKAPSFQATDLNGNRVDFDEIARANKTVFITFWATWCDPCRTELQNLEKLYPGRKASGL